MKTLVQDPPPPNAALRAGLRPPAPDRGAGLRFLFVGGGTGGHLAPALGLAEALQRRGHETFFLTSGRKVEAGFFERGPARASLGLETSRRVPRLFKLPSTFLKARRYARRFDPHLVVGLGGLAGSAALAARRGRPLVLLEGNRVVGKGVRLLQPWARRTLTLFPDTARRLRGGVAVGPLGRGALELPAREAARRKFGLPLGGPLLLVLGGSQGARELNTFAARLSGELARRGGCLIAQTGAGKGRALREACRAAGLPAVVREQIAAMGTAYAAADLALCRGGAATIAELWLAGLPAVVVPYPHHSDRQQEHNARGLGRGAKVLLSGQLEEEGRDAVCDLLFHPARLRAMRGFLEAVRPADGADRAAALLEELAAGPGGAA